MRILIVHTHYQDFGGEDVVFEQEKNLLSVQSDFTISTLTFQNRKGWRGLIQFFLSPWNILAAWRLKKKIKQFGPDIIHIHNTHYASGPLLIRTANKAGIPVVVSLHNFRLICPSATLFHEGKLFTESLHERFPWTAVRHKVLDRSGIKTYWIAFTYWLHRQIGTWQMVDRYLVLTAFAKSVFLESTLHLEAKKMVVKPNFVMPPVPKAIREAKEDFLLYVGRLSSEKGILRFIELTTHLDTPLVIVGDGPDREHILQLTSQKDGVRYIGFQSKDQIIDWMSRASALVVPSICLEGMPMAVLEAFSVGTPILANDLGGLKELVQEGKNGLRFDMTSTASIENTLSRWTLLPVEEKKQVSRHCLESYQSYYNPKSYLHRIREIYSALA